MSDVTCSQCGEPWEIYGLRHDSIAYLDDDQSDQLEPLPAVAEIAEYLSSNGSDADRTLGDALTTILGAGVVLTLPSLFEFWWHSDLDFDDPRTQGAKRVVETAIYCAVLRGQGCPVCGFYHSERGKYRERTEDELMFGSITDEDPMTYLT